MEVSGLAQDITLKSLSKKQVLDMKPGELKVKAKDKKTSGNMALARY
jgi:hypothetical protein